MKRSALFLGLALLSASLIGKAATSSNDPTQCLQNVLHQTSGLTYYGKLNIGTDAWPGDIYAAFSPKFQWLALTCVDPQCSQGGHYGGSMNIACQESSDKFVLNLSGTGVDSATVTIPKSTTIPAPQITVTATAVSGVSPQSDNSGEIFTPGSSHSK